MKKILVVAAHPDDEVLGCGGTLARLVKKGCEIYTLILGEGITSRDNKRDKKGSTSKIAGLKKQSKEANKILGVKEVFFRDFPDNKFDTIPLLNIIKTIEDVKNKLKIDTIFTHYEKDLNIDHQITYKAVLTATRPVYEENVKEIYSFEVPSSTEWYYPLSFSPNVFFDISNTIDIKIKALMVYKSEIKKFPHPRSEKFTRLNANLWGAKAGMQNAEAFQIVRIIK